jgi:hypothetical protein
LHSGGPQGLVFLEGSAVEESNERGGGVSDAVPMMHAWPNFRQGKRRTSTNLGKLLVTNRPKFFLSASFENYYHFLLESLPRFLEVIKHVPDTQVLMPKRHPEFLMKFVEMEGLDFLVLRMEPGKYQDSLS